ncbi:MAG: HU family DNA-binding protein [Candidatus Omnitrophica bacterium]|nr:HU family DNA-binding protein [Candidatus Omnitrophota bacterium]
MNKGDLIQAVSKVTCTKKAASQAVDIVLDSIAKALKKGDTVAIAGFGTFRVSQRKARQGRNPKTGATIQIPARKIPVFKAGAGLKSIVK